MPWHPTSKRLTKKNLTSKRLTKSCAAATRKTLSSRVATCPFRERIVSIRMIYMSVETLYVITQINGGVTPSDPQPMTP
jgi:hypothetical protein